MKFKSDEIVIINQKALNGIPNRIGEKAIILDQIDSFNYDYQVLFDDGELSKVKESELNKLTDEDKWNMRYLFRGNKVIHKTLGIVKVVKVDFIHSKVEIEYPSTVKEVVDFNSILGDGNDLKESEENKLGYFEELGLSIGKLVDEKQKAYGDSVTKCYEIMKVLLQDYHNEENHTYTIPESLLPQMLLDIRKIDKLNRRFSNPNGDLMGENPFQDDVGYSMLGVRMVENLNGK
jgi:hypothetical protein